MMSMDIWQATKRTPWARALSISSSKELTPFCFIIPRIILAPMPPMFIRDRPSFLVPRGIMAPNIRSMNALWTLTFLGLRRIFRPQKVKKMVTFRPMAAAPLAIMKAAMVLSKSPLNTTKVLSFWAAAGAWGVLSSF